MAKYFYGWERFEEIFQGRPDEDEKAIFEWKYTREFGKSPEYDNRKDVVWFYGCGVKDIVFDWVYRSLKSDFGAMEAAEAAAIMVEASTCESGAGVPHIEGMRLYHFYEEEGDESWFLIV